MNLRPALITLAVAFGLLCIAQAVVHAEDAPACLSTEAALAGVAQRYGETPQALGRIGTSSALIITANPDTGTWTAWISPETGTMCPVNGGDHWMVKNAVATSPSSFH